MAHKIKVYVQGNPKKVEAEGNRPDKNYSVRIDGSVYHHVANAEDGTWVYRKANS